MAAAILANGVVGALVVATLPLALSQGLHFDKVHVAAFFVLYSVAGTLLNLGAGRKSDGDMSRHGVAAIAGGVSTLGYLLLSLSAFPPVVYAAGALSSASLVLFSQLFAAAQAHLMATWRAEDQTVGMTTLRTVFTLGYVSGTLAASALGGLVPFREMPYVLAPGLAALSVLAVGAIRRVERAGAHHRGRPAAESRGAVPPAAAVPTVPLALVCVSLAALFLLQGADSTRNVYLPLVELQLFGNARIAPLMFATSATVELITTTAAGYLAARIGEARTIALGGLAGAAYFVVLAFCRLLPVLFAANALYSVFIAALMGVAMSFVFRLVPHRAGVGGALYLATFSGGTLFGAVSPLVVRGYSPGVFLVSAVLCTAGALLILAASGKRGGR